MMFLWFFFLHEMKIIPKIQLIAEEGYSNWYNEHLQIQGKEPIVLMEEIIIETENDAYHHYLKTSHD